MKLVKNKGSILILRDHLPRRISLLFGLPLCSIGATVLVFASQMAVLDCDRETGTPTCTIRRERLGDNETLAIGTPQRALIQEYLDREDDSITYRVAVESDQGIFPITTIHTNGYDDKQQQQAQIEQFIADPSQTNLNIVIHFRAFYILGGAFTLFGLSFLASLFYYTIYRFDRAQNKLSVERSIWGYCEKKTYSLSSVQAVTFEETTDSDGDPLYRVSIFLNTGERLGSKSYHNYFDRKEYAKVAQSITNFLGLLPPSR